MSGEFERIARLGSLFGRLDPPDVGIGDDAAVLHDPRPLVITVDAAVEGVHFDLRWISPDDLAARAIESAVSDLAAMGATPTELLLAWSLPRETTDAFVDALGAGSLRAARRLGMRVAGGNLTGGPVLSLTTTAMGRAAGPLLRRDGARVGDVLAVTGHPGAAAVGLRALMAGRGDEHGVFVERWRSPTARVAEGLAVAGRAHAAIDLSDGLASDAHHMATASGCALVIDVERLPMLPGQRETAAVLGHDVTKLALHGGEDYGLLVAGPADAFDEGWTIIGEVRLGEGVLVRQGEVVTPLVAAGWDHFRSDQGGRQATRERPQGRKGRKG